MDRLDKITDAILASYESGGGINNIDGTNLPSKRAIASICEDLLQLLFPGFHDQEPIHSHHLRRATSYRVQSIADRLDEEICKSLRLDQPDCPQMESEGILCHFLRQLPAIRELLRTDVEAAFNGDPSAASRDEIIVSYPFLEAVAIQRMAHVLYEKNLPLLPRIMTEWAHSRTGTDIHPGAKIGEYFFIDHCTGTVIGETCEIGARVKMYQGVSLIARSLAGGQQLRGTKRHPTIEDGVTIYSGTTIMGGDTVIGAGSTIGANVFLTHSVPPRSLVFYEEKQLRILNKDKRETAAQIDWQI
jgi:serine O-acetyltransferase